jgi:hypothetical protein
LGRIVGLIGIGPAGLRKLVVSAVVLVVLALLPILTAVAQLSGGTSQKPAANPYIHISLSKLADIVKYSGCTFGGLLDGYSGPEMVANETTGQLSLFDNYVDLIGRSDCTYINRASDTWDLPPDFSTIAKNMAALVSRSPRPYVLGQFIAESVALKKPYYYSTESRNFDFKKMCRADLTPTEIHCYASFDQPEYQKYVAYIIQKSIDLGFQVFLIGGAGLTDHQGTVDTSGLLKVIREMRNYAARKGVTILFIAQSPARFGGSAYSDNFDLIQGGAYINADGTLPDSPAVANKGSADANAPPRLWLIKKPDGTPYYDPHKVVSEYDWFGSPLDDSSEVACLSVKSQTYLDNVRAASSYNCPEGHLVGSAVPATQTIYNYLKSIGAGFWLPGRQAIGSAPWIYTPLNLELYQRDTRFKINFNDEGMLSLAGMAQH